jgi:hypothetical protein
MSQTKPNKDMIDMTSVAGADEIAAAILNGVPGVLL